MAKNNNNISQYCFRLVRVVISHYCNFLSLSVYYLWVFCATYNEVRRNRSVAIGLAPLCSANLCQRRYVSLFKFIPM